MSQQTIASPLQTAKRTGSAVASNGSALSGGHRFELRPFPQQKTDLVGWIDFFDHIRSSPSLSNSDTNLAATMQPLVSFLKGRLQKVTKRYEDLDRYLQSLTHIDNNAKVVALDANNNTKLHPSTSVASSANSSAEFERMKNNLLQCWRDAQRAIQMPTGKSELVRKIPESELNRLGLVCVEQKIRLKPKKEEVFENTPKGTIQKYMKSIDSEYWASHHLARMLDHYLRQSPANIPEYSGGAFLIVTHDQVNMIRKIEPWILEHRQTPSIHVYFVPEKKMVLFDT